MIFNVKAIEKKNNEKKLLNPCSSQSTKYFIFKQTILYSNLINSHTINT